MSDDTVQYGPANGDEDLAGILAIQAVNLPHQLNKAEAREQGFVTVRHDLDLLRDMNHPYAHTVAKANHQVIGYTLVMQQHFRDRIPVLFPLFERIDQIVWRGQRLGDWRYFVMGQVAVRKDYRGQGVFAGLYQDLGQRLAPHFDLVVTEIATRNTRSCRAHEKVGFRELQIYHSPEGEEWKVVGKVLVE